MSRRDSASPASFEIMQIGMVLTAMVFLQAPLLGSDNFILPKTLVLTAAGFAVAAVLMVERTAFRLDRLDLVLLTILLLAAVSTVAATNPWYAMASTGVLAASLLLYGSARTLASGGHRDALLAAVAISVGLVAATALVEAYTLLELSNRVPGGTLGNRNRMAHLQVIAAPAVVLLGVRTRSGWVLAAMLGLCTASTAAVVLSRSRGAWLAAIVVLAAALLLLGARKLRGSRPLEGRIGRRLAAFAVCALLGVGTALWAPNRLEWVSDAPYRDTAARLVEHTSGTGAARLVEYRTTWTMIQDRPLLGVGPGNWRVHYAGYAAEDDPNVGLGIIPVRRYPQSEWIGSVAELGVPSFLLLALFAGALGLRWGKVVLHTRAGRTAGYAGAGLLTLVAIGVVGLVDPVLQTPVAGYVAPVLLGAFASVSPGRRRIVQPAPALRGVLVVALILPGLMLANARGREVWASLVLVRGPATETLERAARITPEDYRVRAIAAAVLVDRGDCEGALPHLAAAARLIPSVSALSALAERCD